MLRPTRALLEPAQEIAAAGLSELASGAIFEREAKKAKELEELKAGGLGSIFGAALGKAKAKAKAEAEAEAGGGSSAAEAAPGVPTGPPTDAAAAAPVAASSSTGAAAAPAGADKTASDDSREGTSSMKKRMSSLLKKAANIPVVAEEAPAAQPSSDRLVLIAEAGGITPLVTMLSATNALARENAAGALMHLASDPLNRVSIAKANGILPLVTILDDGTALAHQHAAEALLRLAINNIDNQTAASKHLVSLLANESTGTQKRTAHVLSELAANNPGSPVIIVNAGAISPLVNLLSVGALVVKQEVAGALSNLSLNSPSTQLAIATGLVALLGTGTAEAQEHVTQLLLTLTTDVDNLAAIAKTGAIRGLILQVKGSDKHSSIKAQELAAAVLSTLSCASEANCDAISSQNGIRPLIALLSSESSAAQAKASAVLADLARKSNRNKQHILAEGGLPLFVTLLDYRTRNEKDNAWKDNPPPTRAEAAGALLNLSAGQAETQVSAIQAPSERRASVMITCSAVDCEPHTLRADCGAGHAQKLVAEAGALKLLVNLLNEQDDHARRKGAGALSALCRSSADNRE